MMNEAEGVAHLFERLSPILEDLDLAYEVVCVNDGSTDDTLAALIALQRQNPVIRIIDLSRNFGKEAALTAGLFHARGRAVVPIDADLQDPPELIPAMVDQWRAGYEVVIAVRSERRSDTVVKRGTAQGFYWLINKISDIDVPRNAGDFRLMDRQVIEALRLLPERTRFNKGLFSWLGFRTGTLYYERAERAVGSSKWRYWKLWNFALDGLTAFSSLPLRIWSYLGLLTAVAALIYGVYIIVRQLFFHDIDVPGYASLMTVMLFSNGVVMMGLGVVGEYLSRVFNEVKGRPLYIVRQVIDGKAD